ncbi:hypothetical protein SUGI_0716600 [Cryptomeria japonica]|uniref:NDR1/HIN1-like protein 6 n=1 Tax=Cryptomeria japonica TaxID=3369 RepID=UPI00241491B4|nr:NDR1/HIN1-like protein 6 [Cryptomeria japonica]GLJ35654.1 hypothetical protein SUGI_0716600 [Cryptomeria japonica]
MSEKEDPHYYHSKHQEKPLGQYPKYFSRRRKFHGNFFYSCFVLGFQILMLFAIAIVIAGITFYAVFKPKMPKYSVENFQITSFVVGIDGTVSSQFVVGVRTTNPNKKIGIYYLDDSYIGVFYSGTQLSRGKFPAFYQDHETITTLTVFLSGSDVQLNKKQITLLNRHRVDGSIPLHFKVDLPVKFKVGKLKTPKYTFHVRCDLVLGGLNSRTGVNIGKRKCKVKL